MIDRINEILNAEPDIIDRVDSKNLEDFEVIEFNNLSFRYPNDQSDVIRNINLKIKKGQTIELLVKPEVVKVPCLNHYVNFQ